MLESYVLQAMFPTVSVWHQEDLQNLRQRICYFISVDGISGEFNDMKRQSGNKTRFSTHIYIGMEQLFQFGIIKSNYKRVSKKNFRKVTKAHPCPFTEKTLNQILFFQISNDAYQ